MEIDPRGARFGAILSTIVLAIVLITGSGWLLAAQALVFAVGAWLGLRYAPYGMIYRVLVRPRLGPPRELEDEPPPRFAQGVGAVFTVIGVIGYGTGVTPLALAATAAALAAAFLNAAFGLCLGCEMYLMIQRIRAGGRKAQPESTVRSTLTRRFRHEPF
ncbi:MAG: DUF4395 domain-containing protein [Streptosporangiaceae bacterium]